MTFSTFQQNITFSGNRGELLLFLNLSQKITNVVNYALDAQVNKRQLHAAVTKHDF